MLLADAAPDRMAEYVAGYRGLDGKPDVFTAVLKAIENYGFSDFDHMRDPLTGDKPTPARLD
ncbi:hypothetical protein RA307_10240 [Xanthobacteraceae bacterium Astr-EGSB]|uniref:hypothetical protein n=1 Tax=Astrobacterium formosum TaxID=3069710 RepID=UPI0027B59AA7|nr:hypothetical protein [Xanthobacteraceae bacterium Astr-EGSB]